MGDWSSGVTWTNASITSANTSNTIAFSTGDISPGTYKMTLDPATPAVKPSPKTALDKLDARIAATRQLVGV